jgi:hypothetical protein
MLNEADEVLDEDLQAAADYYDNLLNDTLPQNQAKKIALAQFGVVLDDNVLNRILEQYACTPLSIEDCVAKRLRMSGLI